MKKKLSEVLSSTNAFVTYTSILLLMASFNGVDFGFTADEIVAMFQDKNVTQIFSVILLNFLNPISKLVKKINDGEWSWDFWKSQNFITQAMTVVTLIISAYLGEELAGVVTSLAIQIYNFVNHLVKKATN